MINDRRQPNRLPATWRQILNPIWLLSDDKRNRNFSWISWFLRNPAANLFSVILGLCHRERDVYWRTGDGWTFPPEGGLNYGWSIPVGSVLPRPFVAYRGRFLEVCSGWKTSGVLSLLTIRRAYSPNAKATP